MVEIDVWLLVAFLVCLGLSGFFSSAESALISLPKLRIRYLVETGVKGAKQLARASDEPARFLATVLLGSNLVNVAAATLGTIMAVTAFGKVRGPIIATLGVTALVLIFGEVVPKTLAVHHAQRLALAYIYPLRMIEYCLYPLVLALDRIGLGFARLIAAPNGSRTLMSEGEIRSCINVGQSEGVVEQAEAEMLHKVFDFTDRPVSRVMVPRTEIVWVEQGTKLSDFLRIYAQRPYSRFPVYKDNTDNVVGILFAQDVLMKLIDNWATEEIVVDDLVRPAHFVPESKHLGKLLTEMRDGGYHVAIVVDEFGGVAGMVTLGQLTEEVVGEVKDELGSEDEDFVVTGANSFQLDGGFRLEDANAELGLELPPGDYAVAGFILSHLGRIPKQGEQLKYRNLIFDMTQMRGAKIEKVTVTEERGGSPKQS